jgi:hypothetical protein
MYVPVAKSTTDKPATGGQQRQHTGATDVPIPPTAPVADPLGTYAPAATVTGSVHRLRRLYKVSIQ